MSNQPVLSQEQWGMVLQLIEQERESLPAEIRHTDSQRVHDQLKERMKILDAMITRIREAVVVTA